MNRMRVAVSVAALALAAALLLRPPVPGSSAPPARTERRPVSPPAEPAPSTSAIAPPARDVFTYSGEDDAGRAEQPAMDDGDAMTLAAPPPLDQAVAPSVPEGPRLVGIVRQAGTLKAVLSVEGEVVVLRAGERAGSYRVASVDEDEGVRLVDEAGTTVVLPPH
jgi:hypothetical protein